MEHLLQPQIKETCRLNMPEGLKELMSDISREVLRAQPSDIHEFIASYLSAMLVTRDNLTIASQVCTHVCECDCQPELFRELRDIGLTENDAAVAQDIIIKYFNKQTKVDEGNLLALLLEKTAIEGSMFPAVIDAVRTAYMYHQTRNYTKYETSSESGHDEVSIAATHTLKLYRETRPSEEQYSEMAAKIQTSYRAYGVKRDNKSQNDRSKAPESKNTSPESSFSEEVKTEMELKTSMHKKRMNTVSSISLAGSYCNLPRHKPYNVHDVDRLSQLEETSDKEHAHIDYTARSPHVSIVNKITTENRNKKISFQNDNDDNKTEYGEGESEKDKSHSTLQYDDNTDKQTCYYDEHILKVDDELDYKNLQDAYESIPGELVDSEGYDGDDNEDDTEVNSTFEYVNLMNKEADSDSGDDDD